MSVLVSAVEVGSVRALVPVCNQLIKYGFSVIIEKRGHFDIEIFDELSMFLFDLPKNENELKLFMVEKKITSFLFSVNIHDSRPLRIARLAKELNIFTFHLLDYWNDYRGRLERDQLDMFIPTRYFVPDEFALKKSIQEGVPRDIIKIVGQPAFSDSHFFYKISSLKKSPFNFINQNNKKILLFISEPVSDDQGRSYEENPNYRGYTEEDVLKILIKALSSLNENYLIVLLPHPRQNIEKLKLFWRLSGGESFGEIYISENSRKLLPFVDGVIGMASTLLYESWLIGKTALSIQPGVIKNNLEMMNNKKGFEFIYNYDNAQEIVVKWLLKLKDSPSKKTSGHIELHKNSAKRVIEEIIKFDKIN